MLTGVVRSRRRWTGRAMRRLRIQGTGKGGTRRMRMGTREG